MNIPFLDLKAEYHRQKGQILAAIEQVLEGMQLHNGPQQQALEEEFAAYCGARHAIAVGSGTEALLLAYMAAGIGYGDEVLVPSHTFIATVAPLAFLGAKPVFVDIDPDTYTIDPLEAERAITPRTRAIVPVHIYGHPADMSSILEIAQHRHLRVVEDACQAVGAQWRGQRVGSLGDLGCFSFVFTKNLKGYGDAGMVTTDNDDFADHLRLLRDHGRASKNVHPIFGLNCRLDEIQAAIIRVQMRLHEERTERRRSIAHRYTEALRGTGLATPHEAPHVRHVYHLYVVRVPGGQAGTPGRNELAEWLAENGISTGIHYPIPCHLQGACARYGCTAGSLPITERCANEILSLPVYPELSEEQVDRIIEKLQEFASWQAAQLERKAV
jgi:dTDP-4-amino-4,6-dideoxygalactose transaminase